jgi:chromosomal replication initiation ATPase DnaA
MTRLWPNWYKPPRFVPMVSIARQLTFLASEMIGCSPEELCGESRRHRLVQVRSLVATVLKERGWSYPRISRALGRRDHSTAMHACRQVDVYLKINPDLAPVLDSLRHMSRGV